MKRLGLVVVGVLLSMSLSAQSMKMVVNAKGEVVGRYVETQPTTYFVNIQDVCEVPRKGHRVVTFSAAAGQGILFRRADRTGNINVREKPTVKSRVVGKIVEFDGAPETFPCLGKVGEWYKTRVQGKVGFVRQDMVEWDGMDTF